MPDSFKDVLKTLLKTPHVGEYLKAAKTTDQGFDFMYALYSNFVHPTFAKPRDQFLADIGLPSEGVAFKDAAYYSVAQKQPSPANSLKRDISAAGFCLELTWPEIMDLDPMFDNEYGLFKAASQLKKDS